MSPGSRGAILLCQYFLHNRCQSTAEMERVCITYYWLEKAYRLTNHMCCINQSLYSLDAIELCLELCDTQTLFTDTDCRPCPKWNTSCALEVLQTYNGRRMRVSVKSTRPCRPGVSNSTYLGAAGGRVWVRLGRIKYSTKKGFHVLQKKEHNLINLYY